MQIKNKMLPDRPHNLHTRNEVMKPAYIFRDRINTVVQWFDQWNDIEQTIACYSLLKRLGATQARFLSLVLEHTFKDSAYDVQIFEKEANAKDFLRGLCHESKEVAVQQLLLHLPLLHPGNDEARHEYLKLLPKILSHSLEYSIHEEECRQLLSLALVHPAFVPEERNSLTWWLGLIEDKGEKTRPPPGFNASVAHSPLTGTKSACELWGNHKAHVPVSNTLSYRPPSITSNGWKNALTQRDSGISTSFDNGSIGLAYPAAKGTRHEHDVVEEMGPRSSRSRSFPADPELHMPLSPQSSLESDEENALRKMTSSSIENLNPGMKDVTMWLKSLRLHKYAPIFYDLTYDDMLKLDETYLTQKGVTKGARNKILLSIQKIREREKTLLQLEKEVLQPGRIPHVLQELKNILMSPIKASDNNTTDENQLTENDGEYVEPTNEDIPSEKSNEVKEIQKDENKENDLPSLISRVMGKACTQILVVSQPDEECCLTYLGLLDRVISHEAFSRSDKRRLQSWKAQCQKLARQLATNRKLAGIEKGPKNWFDPFGNGGALGRRRAANRTNSLKGGSMILIPVARAGPLVATQSLHRKLAPTSSYHVNAAKTHTQLSRTKSAPIKSNHVIFQSVPFGQQDADGINKSLETLCLSMTNHALDDEKSED